MDVLASPDERVRIRTAKSCGPDTPTLVSSSQDDLAGDRGKKARFPGESAKETVKTVAQGMPVVPAEPVVPAASFSYCWRAMGAASIRHSLRPLC
jgi:hypothetical protein